LRATDIVATPEAERGFYPTPPSVAEKMLEGIDWMKVSTVLEPSAGSGNLVKAVLKEYRLHRYRSSERSIDVDCVEIDPSLRAILRYEFGAEKNRSLYNEKDNLESKRKWDSSSNRYNSLPPQEQSRLDAVREEISQLDAGDVRIIHDDFLSLDTCKLYDLIIMNPPFSNGDVHLLKAIQMQQRNGGEIRCILNAETIRNPFSNARRLLQKKLLELNAQITFMENAFSDAQRKTNVEIALISVAIPREKEESEIFSRLKKSCAMEKPEMDDVTDMTVSDFMERVVTQYKVECEAGIALMREYQAMQPYILDSFEKDRYSSPTLTLAVGDPSRTFRGDSPNVNKFLRLTRLKYWRALFSNKDFTGRLTSNLLSEYQDKVDKLADYDFTLFNIQAIAAEMNAEMGKGIEETIVALFDKMTAQHSYYPEMAKNIHYYNGWKTNKVHKINNKVILPIYGVFADRYWSKETFRVSEAEGTIGDIEKVFDYLDGNMTAPVSLHGALQRACDEGRTRNIQCKFFDVTLYKKGTMHIRFRNQELVDRFNIYCSRKKNWLPPNYGKVSYADMAENEKSVIDGFHGDGTSGTGAEEYAKVMAKAAYFLSEPVKEVPLLTAGE